MCIYYKSFTINQIITTYRLQKKKKFTKHLNYEFNVILKIYHLIKKHQ